MISFNISSLLNNEDQPQNPGSIANFSSLSFGKPVEYTQGERLIDAAETLERVQGLLPVFGITRVANVTGLDHIGIPVVMATRPNSRSISVSQGKGLTLSAAKASAVMESIEAYHAENIRLPILLSSYAEMYYTHRLADVSLMPQSPNSPFHPNYPILWVEGTDLMNGCTTMVPFETVSINFCLPKPAGHGCFPSNSNGLASGNHLLEAINHGISEVIERDATTLWNCLQSEHQAKTKIDTSTVDEPGCVELLARYKDANILVGVWEMTSNLGIPTFLCRIIENTPPPHHGFRPSSGMGCHPNRAIALRRALTEAAQSRLTFISGARDDMPRQEYEAHLQESVYFTWRKKIEDQQQRHFNDGASWHSRNIAEDIDWQLGRLKACGINQVIAVNLTRKEFGIPVVKIIIPGLEGIASSPSYKFGPRAQKILIRHQS